MSQQTDKLMKVEDVAERLNVSHSFVYDLMKKGRLRFHRLGAGQGGLRIAEEALQAYLKATEEGGEHKEPPAPPVKLKHFQN